ncbi:SdrD B-like domain-containing protein [Sorangium sp. So ce1036]|uniref:SdrD B-like domain-containing protein n=1 Tax=Sorangium sp. So ce1036 TaxID=3133328 RepID=UPI003F00509B
MKQITIASSAALATLFVTSASLAETSAPPAPTCTVIMRGGLGDLPDSEIWSLNPSYAVPDSYEVNTGYSSTAGEKRALFGFDLGPIPAGSLIASARFYAKTYTSTAQAVRVHRVLAPWAENVVTWNNLGGIDPTAFTSFVPSVTQWSEIDLTELVQEWVSGISPNYGILLEEDQGGKTSYKSSDHPTIDNHPFLEVCFTAAKGSIGDKVWFDADADGVEGASEPGIANVVLDLFGDADCDGAADGDPLAATATDADGAYRFGELDAGCYVVSIDDMTLPLGHLLTTGAEPLAVSIGAGEDVTDADFGYVTYSSIGDTVWLDSDADGLYEPEIGELGVNGVLVELYHEGVMLDAVTTGDSPYTGQPGFYLFDSLAPGDYEIVITADNFMTSGPLAGQEPTADRDGVLDSVTTVSLAPAQDLLDADFGYQLSCGNGVCGGDESCSTCAVDCGICPPVCGNGTCEVGEDCGSCSADCDVCPPVCGNGTCEAGEDCGSCSDDCGACPPVCGNGACEAGEDCGSCSDDCGACPAVCGNNVCENGEDCANCAGDCGACPAVCGNDTCEAGEDCLECPSDCGICPPVCGSGVCEVGETCSSCAADCGECPPVCGDGVCKAGSEDCSSCAADCGACQCASPGTGTPGYWKNHPRAWRVSHLTIGRKTYTKSQLLDIISRPTKGDVTYILAKHLIVAKLNVGIGNQSSCIEDTIAQADAWLRQYPLGSNVKDKGKYSPWASGEPLAETLDNYNNGRLCAPHRDALNCDDSNSGGDRDHSCR